MGGSKMMVGSSVAFRGDFRMRWKERGQLHTQRISELHLLAPNRAAQSGELRGVTVKVTSSLGDDDQQEAVTDRVIGSVRTLGTRA